MKKQLGVSVTHGLMSIYFIEVSSVRKMSGWGTIFYRPCRGLIVRPSLYPRLAPWAGNLSPLTRLFKAELNFPLVLFRSYSTAQTLPFVFYCSYSTVRTVPYELHGPYSTARIILNVPYRTLKYLACLWWTMRAVVDCSGSSWNSSLSSTPMRPGFKIGQSLSWSSKRGQAG